MVLFKSTGMAVAVTFGLALAGSFWWEVAEPIRNSNWSGSGEQWLALGSLIFGGCATLVAAGAFRGEVRWSDASRPRHAQVADRRSAAR